MKKYKEFISNNTAYYSNTYSSISENLKYHLDNNMSITENIFRPNSKEFYNILKETRELFDLCDIDLCDIDKELFENTDIGIFSKYKNTMVPLDTPIEYIDNIEEANYKGKEVKLNSPKRGGSKKFYVYVKNKKNNKVIKIEFGDTSGLNVKVSNPKARKSFAARHKCDTKKDKTKAGYWACRINKYGYLWNGKTYSGYW